ncbi:hypothetical protein V9T40_006398 [Parthenolecanium corni]|uniref:Potassium channel domain-containing protein n=1 Tax=Parthenolecanium corni TaxID=536013 RepID=A0AAN9TKQ3_9HEMI
MTIPLHSIGSSLCAGTQTTNYGMDESKKIPERIRNATNTELEHNEQVIFICPGCNMSKDDADKKSCCDSSRNEEAISCGKGCGKSAKKLKLFVLSGPGLTILLLSYLMVGAVTFNALEGGRKFDIRDLNISKNDFPYRDIKIKEAVERLWKITENLNVLYKDNWTKLAEMLTKKESSLVSECNTKNYLSNRKNSQQPFWNLGECFLYSLSLLTTVGSGNVLPRTIWGRVISVFYITIGFFIMLVYLAVIGDCLANPFRRVYRFITHTPSRTKPIITCTVPNCDKARLLYRETISIPIWLAAIVLVTYITGGAFIFNVIEKWTLLDSWYFCFLSLVTIGFGSFTPGRMENISMMVTSAYILIGMALLSMCFNLVQMDIIAFFRNLYVWSERDEAMANARVSASS